VVVCVAHVLVIQVGKQRRIERDLSSRKEARRPQERRPASGRSRGDNADECLMVVEIYSPLCCAALLCSWCFPVSNNIYFVLFGTRVVPSQIGFCQNHGPQIARRSWLARSALLAPPSPLFAHPSPLRIDSKRDWNDPLNNTALPPISDHIPETVRPLHPLDHDRRRPHSPRHLCFNLEQSSMVTTHHYPASTRHQHTAITDRTTKVCPVRLDISAYQRNILLLFLL
jgi:hypothetical protein